MDLSRLLAALKDGGARWAEIRAFLQAWMDRLSRTDAECRGLLKIYGPPALVRAFPRWFDCPSVPQPAVRVRTHRLAAAM